MDDTTDTGKLMAKAARGTREQLFAALQAALVELTDAHYIRHHNYEQAIAEVERRLDLGVTYGGEPV